MKYKVTEINQRRLEQFARSNFAPVLFEIISDRIEFLNEQFRRTQPEVFQQIQGRALELDDLLTALKVKGSGE